MGNIDQTLEYEVPFQGAAQRSALFRDMDTYMPRLERIGAIGSYSMVNGSSEHVTVRVDILDPTMKRIIDSKVMAYAGAREI